MVSLRIDQRLVSLERYTCSMGVMHDLLNAGENRGDQVISIQQIRPRKTFDGACDWLVLWRLASHPSRGQCDGETR